MVGGGRDVSLPGVVFLEAELSLRNCSRKDICEEGRSPSTAPAIVILITEQRRGGGDVLDISNQRCGDSLRLRLFS
jgi:hypothetical protein